MPSNLSSEMATREAIIQSEDLGAAEGAEAGHQEA